MDEQLAAIYGTGMPDDEDLAKTASAELLVKLAEEEGVDLDDFSDEEIAEMITNLQGEEKTAGDETQEIDEESQEKLAEADYLGRVMAHAMVQELGDIEKEAGRLGNLGRYAKEVYQGAGGGAKGVGAVAKRFGQHQAQAGKSMGRSIKSLVTGKAPSAAKGGKGATVSAEGGVRRAALRGLGESSKQLAPSLVAAGGGTAATIAALKGKGKKKNASALAKLAEDRAYEILAETGWVDEEGNVFAPQQHEEEKVAGLDLAVEQEALQMLEEAGYPVQWNEE
jgi:hypothetical protein